AHRGALAMGVVLSHCGAGRAAGAGIAAVPHPLGAEQGDAPANPPPEPLPRGTVTIDTFKQVQPRREFPTRVTQRLQIIMQNRIIGPALANKNTRPKAPLFMKMVQWPLLRRLPGRLLAYGIRPEHVHTPAP